MISKVIGCALLVVCVAVLMVIEIMERVTS